MSSVTVVAPNARRYVVKVTPAKLLREVLEEACLASGFDADTHRLKHQKKWVDSSLPFRLSGLPNHATLDMEPFDGTAASAEVAVQLPSGDRQQKAVSTTASLWQVLEELGSSLGRSLVAVGGEEEEGTVPAVSYMNKQYRGEAELRATSLRAMGITGGRVLVRYQRVSMSESERAALASRLEEGQRRREEQTEQFERRKRENAEREREEKERERKFAEECRRVEAEREEAERKKMEQEKEQRPAPQPLDRLPASVASAAPGEWSFDRHAFAAPAAPAPPPAANSRLAHLQRLLEHVDTSLHANMHDNLVDQLMGQGGRLQVNALMQMQQQTSGGGGGQQAAPFKFPEVSSSQPAEAMESEEEKEQPVEKCERLAMIFSKTEQSVDEKREGGEAMEVEEGFFELSVDDVKSIQRDRREEVRRFAQKALVPKSYIEKKNRELKMEAYRNTVVRIQLGDRRLVQALFRSNEPATHLYDFFRSLLRDERKEFDLNFALNCRIDNGNKNLIEMDIAPSTTVYAKMKGGVEDYGGLFKDGSMVAANQEEADAVSKEWLSHNHPFVPYNGTVEEESRTVQMKRQAENSETRVASPQATLPKWMKKK